MITAKINKISSDNTQINVSYSLSNQPEQDRSLVFGLGSTAEEIKSRIKLDVDRANALEEETNALEAELLNLTIN